MERDRRDINGPGKPQRREKTRGSRERKKETAVVDQWRQGEAGRGFRDAWHRIFFSAVALAVTQRSHDGYIYQAAV